MLLQLLRAAKVTDLERGLLFGIEKALGVDKDVIWFDVPMGDPFGVKEGQTLEKLVA